MPKYSRGVIRLLGVLALLAVIQPVATSLVVGDAGRDFTRCVQGCNETRKTCDDGCATTCRDLYPSDKPARDACIAACKAICLAHSDDCKLECQVFNHPPSPTEP